MTTDTAERSQAGEAEAQTPDAPAQDADLEAARSLIDEMEPPAPVETPEETASADTGTEPPATEENTPDTFTEDLVKARLAAAREEWEQEQEQARQAKEQEETERKRESSRREGVKAAQTRRVEAIRAWSAERGLSKEDTDQLANTFLNHASEASDVERWEMTEAIRAKASEQLPETQRETFIAKHKDSDDFESFLTDFREEVVKDARTGYYTEAQKEDARAVGALQYQKWLTDKDHPERIQSLLSGTNLPKARNGSQASRPSSFRTKAEARAKHVNGEISNAEMRTINASDLPES